MIEMDAFTSIPASIHHLMKKERKQLKTNNFIGHDHSRNQEVQYGN
jgi:hypothetical protein